MPQDDNELQAILEYQANRQQAHDITKQVTSEIKNSLVFHTSWEQLLQNAPTALSSIGACFVASSSPNAQVQLSPPKDKGFQYLRFNSLQANLVECGNMGRMAFMEVESKMGAITLTTQAVIEKINDIIPTIYDPQSARRMLRPQFQTVSRGAEDCLQASIAMDKKFADWLLFACELYAACVRQESTTRQEDLSNEICLAAESTCIELQKSAGDETGKSQELLAKQVTAVANTSKKASDEFPPGWDMMGEQIVSDLAGAVTSALNAAIPTFMNSLTPMVKPSAGIIPVPKDATDPGYTEVQMNSAFLSILHVIVAGQKDGGINWEIANSSYSNKFGESSTINFVIEMLRDAKQRFRSLATSQEPSQTLIKVLDVSLQVAQDLQASAKSNTYPGKDSGEVRRWQADFAEVYARANTLLATARTIPGTAANSIPLISSSDGPSPREARITATSAQEQAVLEASRNRLTTTTKMLTATRENYSKSVDMLSQQQNKLADIQATLANLTTSSISLTEIKRTLFESIKLIIELKNQVITLIRFFMAIRSVLDICMGFCVEPFLETIKAITSGDDDPNQAFRVGSYRLIDLQRSQVFSAALTLRSYFTVFGDIAKMWVTLSQEVAMPGLKICDEISYTAEERNPEALARKMRMLSQWSQESTDRVKRISGDKQRDIMDGMQSRIDDFWETTRDISAPSTSTFKAVEAGTAVTEEAARKSIEQRINTSALNRFSVG
ncbi:uncharacterized protein B0J16DRAFT_417757 [Fusarium flagelliforme]|uniref:uncharacterized protein n=1 Tax=Fusarium flagelliforme TaxID=2675880 RepID=UPI001E8CD2E7|nr:uncharacterized protein B0J16DRAFT_417757 [Fusarium flagelliforme]KAH7174207.1 hypothetical protein B0J16DRAFT_417757 [Fusarium flagelliforme]